PPSHPCWRRGLRGKSPSSPRLTGVTRRWNGNKRQLRQTSNRRDLGHRDKQSAEGCRVARECAPTERVHVPSHFAPPAESWREVAQEKAPGLTKRLANSAEARIWGNIVESNFS